MGEGLLCYGQLTCITFGNSIDTVKELLHIDVEFNLDIVVLADRDFFDDVATNHLFDFHRTIIKNLGPGHDLIELSLHLLDFSSFLSFNSAVSSVMRSLLDSTFCTGVLQHLR